MPKQSSSSSASNIAQILPPGVASALVAYIIWGFSPVYFKWLADVPAIEIIAHRVIWSFGLVLLLLAFTGKFNHLWAVYRVRQTRYLLALTTILVSSNWLIFIWAIGDGRILETSLGYYINPLVNVLLGMIFLQERLNKWQGVSVAMAVIAIAIMVFGVGKLPWVSLTLAFSFGFYALVRKKIMVDSAVGLAAETGYLFPISLGYLVYLFLTGTAGSQGHFGDQDWTISLLLMGTGLITGIPLLLYVVASKRMKLMTLGILQYLAPTLHFLLAVFVYEEDFGVGHIIAFAFIWAGLGVYTWDSYRQRKLRQNP